MFSTVFPTVIDKEDSQQKKETINTKPAAQPHHLCFFILTQNRPVALYLFFLIKILSIMKVFDVSYVYYDALFGSYVNVYQINADEYLHYILDYDIHFISQLPF